MTICRICASNINYDEDGGHIYNDGSVSTITDGTEEQLLRLSEHCTKMSKTINVILQHEKEQVNV